MGLHEFISLINKNWHQFDSPNKTDINLISPLIIKNDIKLVSLVQMKEKVAHYSLVSYMLGVTYGVKKKTGICVAFWEKMPGV